MLRILIVEDAPELASQLKFFIEENALYEVIGVADNAHHALDAVHELKPDIVLLDLKLSGGTTGFTVAAKLADLQIMCLFVSGKAPTFSMPDLAVGCLMKPFTGDDVLCTLAIAEDLLRGHETLRFKIPQNLRLYGLADDECEEEQTSLSTKLSLRTRIDQKLAKWAQNGPPSDPK